jgi:hypothetical protein
MLDGSSRPEENTKQPFALASAIQQDTNTKNVIKKVLILYTIMVCHKQESSPKTKSSLMQENAVLLSSLTHNKLQFFV